MNDKRFQVSKMNILDYDMITFLDNGTEELQMVILHSLYSNLHKADNFLNAVADTSTQIYQTNQSVLALEFWDLEEYCNKALQFYQNASITQLDLLRKTLDLYVYELLDKNLNYLLYHKAKSTLKWASKYSGKVITDEDLQSVISQYTLDNSMKEFCNHIFELLSIKESMVRA